MRFRIEITDDEKKEAIKDYITKRYPTIMQDSDIIGIYPALNEITLKTKESKEYER